MHTNCNMKSQLTNLGMKVIMCALQCVFGICLGESKRADDTFIL